jgi:D-3-phosphoglycerate dehydrogenase
MAPYKVVFTETIFSDVNIEQEILDKVGAGISVGHCKTEDEVVEIARDADAVVTFTFKPVSDYVMSHLKQCKIIVRGGIGVDTVDIPAATRNGIIITNIPQYCAEEVSNLTMAMMLALLHKLPIAMKQTARGEWNFNVVKPLRSLWTLTLGIIGFGNIGRLSARKALTFGMKVLFYDPFVKTKVKDLDVEQMEFDELLGRSDVILLHAPATDQTYHIINRETLRKVKHGCLLVNTARGQLVDTEALVEALENGTLAGAGLDLIENVPPLGVDHPLLKFDNVIITPYYAWYTEDSVLVLRKTIASEIARLLGGYYPQAIVNPEVKPTARAGKLKEGGL